MCIGVIKTKQLTQQRKVLLEKPIDFQLVEKFSAFFEPEGLLPSSQQLASCPDPEVDGFSPRPSVLLP
jgi:hypothetical protein